jgi:hypothetical protein
VQGECSLAVTECTSGIEEGTSKLSGVLRGDVVFSKVNSKRASRSQPHPLPKQSYQSNPRARMGKPDSTSWKTGCVQLVGRTVVCQIPCVEQRCAVVNVRTNTDVGFHQKLRLKIGLLAPVAFKREVTSSACISYPSTLDLQTIHPPHMTNITNNHGNKKECACSLERRS